MVKNIVTGQEVPFSGDHGHNLINLIAATQDFWSVEELLAVLEVAGLGVGDNDKRLTPEFCERFLLEYTEVYTKE